MTKIVIAVVALLGLSACHAPQVPYLPAAPSEAPTVVTDTERVPAGQSPDLSRVPAGQSAQAPADAKDGN